MLCLLESDNIYVKLSKSDSTCVKLTEFDSICVKFWSLAVYLLRDKLLELDSTYVELSVLTILRTLNSSCGDLLNYYIFRLSTVLTYVNFRKLGSDSTLILLEPHNSLMG